MAIEKSKPTNKFTIPISTIFLDLDGKEMSEPVGHDPRTAPGPDLRPLQNITLGFNCCGR